jgi:hypothetical protein
VHDRSGAITQVEFGENVAEVCRESSSLRRGDFRRLEVVFLRDELPTL